MCLKPRYHRINFLLEADKNKILVFGKNTVNTQFIEEYKTSTQEGVIYTDSTKRHNENHKKYFTKEYFEKFLNIINKIKVTSESSNIRFNHAFEYFKNKEYEDSYIEVSGETHCIFDLKYGFFTEKSYKAILGEKFGMIYGSSKVYSEFKKIGINLFLDEFELNGIENKNELEQIQMIVNSLKKLDREKIKNLYISKYKDIKNNKEKLFKYYCSIMNDINVLLLKDKNIL
jgi:hypothetical protein